MGEFGRLVRRVRVVFCGVFLRCAEKWRAEGWRWDCVTNCWGLWTIMLSVRWVNSGRSMWGICGVMIKWDGVCGNIYNIVIFHLLAVVWTTRWAIVKNSSAIAKISSELVEISSELVLSNSELLIIGVYRKTSKLVSRTLFSLWNEGRGELFIFVLIYLYITRWRN